MKRALSLAIACVISFAALGYAASGTDTEPDVEQELLTLSVRINSGADAAGSGTVLWSKDAKTYVLTNFHVIDGAKELTAEWFQRDDWFDSIRKSATVVASDKDMDLALLEIDGGPAPRTACLSPEDAVLHPGEDVWAVGAGLGMQPFPTRGMLGLELARGPSGDFIVASAPIIFGNSGGGLFRRGEHCPFEMIGVPSRMPATLRGVVSHMGMSIPMAQVRKFLRDNGKGFILGDPD